MHTSVSNFISVKRELELKIPEKNNTNIIAVSKTFDMSMIKPLIDYGHQHFGENKVQEALEKWTDVKNSAENIQLHMIGKLQTNKVKYVIPLFDYIHSLDNFNLAKKISQEQKKKNKNLKIFIQINIGNEKQKSGIDIGSLKDFYSTCVNELQLNIIGLMCIPPQNKDISFHFKKMSEIQKSIGVKELSMGMSSDYLEAIKYGASFVRIGSKIFGERA